jgi:hypothetical protein
MPFAPAAPSTTPPTSAIPKSDAERAPDDVLSRLFNIGKDGVVSLKLLPKGTNRSADALLLLLYGYRRLKNADNIYGTQLMKAARVSGVLVERIDRSLSPHADFFMRGGRKRSANYTINNQGVTAAEAMIKTIFD